MTSLEKFLIKRQTAKTIEDPKEKEKITPKINSELLNATEQLKSIFPNESEDSIMLLALQYPNPRDLDEAVQKILEETTSLKQVTEDWNVVKARDKKKPELNKKKYNKRKFQEENYDQGYYQNNKGYKNEYPRYYGQNKSGYYYDSQRKYNKVVENPKNVEKNPLGPIEIAQEILKEVKEGKPIENKEEIILPNEEKKDIKDEKIEIKEEKTEKKEIKFEDFPAFIENTTYVSSNLHEN